MDRRRRSVVPLTIVILSLASSAIGSNVIGSSTISQCGGEAESDSYLLEMSAGQPVADISSSSSFVEIAGFWYRMMPWDPHVGIETVPISASRAGHVFANSPNPFNERTVISYSLSETAHVTLTVYNAVGQKVKTLIDGEQRAGDAEVEWDGKDDSGVEVASGIYFCQLKVGDLSNRMKVLVLR